MVANYAKSHFSTIYWVAEGEENREVYSTEILLNTVTFRKVNLTSIDSFFA